MDDLLSPHPTPSAFQKDPCLEDTSHYITVILSHLVAHRRKEKLLLR